MEAETGHVVLDASAVVVLLSVTPAGHELGCLLLPSQDGNGIETSAGALLAVKHGTAVLVIIF